MSAVVLPMHQAKSSLSQLVKRATRGETIFIGSYGRAEAMISPVAYTKHRKILGLLQGKLTIPDSFDDPLPPEVLAAFEGNLT